MLYNNQMKLQRII